MAHPSGMLRGFWPKIQRSMIGVLLATAFLFYGFSEAEDVTRFRVEVQTLIYQHRFEDAQKKVVDFLKKKDLSDLSNFHGHYLYAEVLKGIGEADAALDQLARATQYLPKGEKETSLLSLLLGSTAECHFNLGQFERAKELATESMNASPDTSFREGGHAINLIILGYTSYLEKDFNNALKDLEEAVETFKTYGQPCEFPLAYLKMARVYNEMHQEKKMKDLIERSSAISDSCEIDAYIALTKQTLFDIQKRNNDYAGAMTTMEELNNFNTQMARSLYRRSMSDLEFQYSSKLAQQENANLQEINVKNMELLKKQRLAIYTSTGAILILIIFSFFLKRAGMQREKAKEALSVLNIKLENKVNQRTEYLIRANEQIEAVAEKLENQNKQFIDFFNIISHNFRGPLSNLTMLVQFIKAAENGEEKDKMVQNLEPVVANLTTTCNELLESMVIMQDKHLIFSEIPLEKMVDKVLRNFEIEIGKTGASIHTDFSKANIVHAPVKYLESILSNLVDNALKYRSAERVPHINIKSKMVDDGVRITIKDNGLGIDLNKYGKDLFKIRKVFHNHPEARGFGLFLIKNQIEAIGGEIWVESIPNDGSTFFMLFRNKETSD